MENKQVKSSVKQRIVAVSNELKLNNDGDVNYASKTGKTAFKYITPASIMNELKPLLKTYDLFLHFNLEKLDAEMNLATLTISDASDDKAYEPVRYTMHASDIVMNGNSAQGTGALRTYCKRYLCIDAFCIADNSEDLEGKEVKDKPYNRAVSQPKPQAEPRTDIITAEIQQKILENATNGYGIPKQAMRDFVNKQYNKNNFIGLSIKELDTIQDFIEDYVLHHQIKDEVEAEQARSLL